MSSNNNDTTSQRLSVIGVGVNVLTWEKALNQINTWAIERQSKYVCITNVHAVVTASKEPDFGAVTAQADLVTPDGAPVAWMMRKLGASGQARINGPDLMWKYCELSERSGMQSIFLYGSTPETLALLQVKLKEAFPGLQIAGAYSPPFRPLSSEEDAEVVDMINASGAGTVWVSLGCPKQELWMAAHRGRIHAVMVGVGAAFDYHAGTIQRAPHWMRNAGLEWLHRLASEPRRLARRYFVTNTLFVLGSVRQLCRRRNQNNPEPTKH